MRVTRGATAQAAATRSALQSSFRSARSCWGPAIDCPLVVPQEVIRHVPFGDRSAQASADWSSSRPSHGSAAQLTLELINLAGHPLQCKKHGFAAASAGVVGG